jgi:hypothetical protein
MFRGIGAAEKHILAYLALRSPASNADIRRAFPKLHRRAIGRAMRSLAAKDGCLLDERGIMTVRRLGLAAPPVRQPQTPASPVRQPQTLPASNPYGLCDAAEAAARAVAREVDKQKRESAQMVQKTV